MEEQEKNDLLFDACVCQENNMVLAGVEPDLKVNWAMLLQSS